MDILLLAYYYPPQNTSGAARPARFAKYLAEHGCICRVVSAQATEAPQGGFRNLAAAGAARLVQRYWPYHEHIEWIPTAVTQARRLIERHNIAAILSTSPPVSTHVVALWLKRRYGLPWVADFRDPIEDSPFRGLCYDPALERAIFRHADVCIANTDTLAEVWGKRHSDAAGKVTVIWNGFDPSEKIPPAHPRLRQRKVLAHIGSIYGGRTPTLVLDSLRRLIRSGRLDPGSVGVELVGDLSDVSLAGYSDLRENGFVRCAGRYVPRSEALQFMVDADYLLLLDTNAKGTGMQVPAKLFDYLRSGQPVLAVTCRNSPTERILSRSGVSSTCLYPDDPESLLDAKVISFLRFSTTPVIASPWFWNEFDGRVHAQTLARILGRLTADTRSQVSASPSEPRGRRCNSVS
jgi:glycosyltransferase involved in cell wall biosynthesis